MEEALFIVRDLISGLHFAFKEHGVLHLDVKPQNILFRHDLVGRTMKYSNDPVRQYNWVVSDWGLASVKNATLARLATLPPPDDGVATINNLGTVPYTAPERFIRGVTPSVASDLFAVGLVLYEMLIGELPYQRSNPDVAEQIRSHSYFDTAKMTLAQQRIPKLISETILSLIAPDPELRCRSYTEVIERLNEFQRPRSIISRIFKSN
jgi:serine/threonine protein kinase